MGEDYFKRYESEKRQNQDRNKYNKSVGWLKKYFQWAYSNMRRSDYVHTNNIGKIIKY